MQRILTACCKAFVVPDMVEIMNKERMDEGEGTDLGRLGRFCFH